MWSYARKGSSMQTVTVGEIIVFLLLLAVILYLWML
jgi:hypothetical protein